MAKKPKPKREGLGVKFSIKALCSEIDNVMTRIKAIEGSSPAKAELRRKIEAIQLIAYCGQDMSFDL